MSAVVGYGDEVRGFDQTAVDESIDHLDIYAEFLGYDEYEAAKDNYSKALSTMEQLYRLEIERLQFSQAPQVHYQVDVPLLTPKEVADKFT